MLAGPGILCGCGPPMAALSRGLARAMGTACQSLVPECGHDLVVRHPRRERGNLEDNLAQRPCERERRLVVIAHREAPVAADQQAGAADLPPERQVHRQAALGDDLAVDAQHDRTAGGLLAAVLDAERVWACRHRRCRLEPVWRTEQVERK